MVVAVLFKAGVHAPVIPFVDVVGKADNVPPEQIAATGVKVGVTFELTVTTVAADVAEQLLLFVTTTVYDPDVVAV